MQPATSANVKYRLNPKPARFSETCSLPRSRKPNAETVNIFQKFLQQMGAMWRHCIRIAGYNSRRDVLTDSEDARRPANDLNEATGADARAAIMPERETRGKRADRLRLGGAAQHWD